MEPHGSVGVLDRELDRDDLRIEQASAAPTAGEAVLTQQVRYYTAICAFGAGVLHLLAMAAHADHHPTLGRAFLAVAVLQIAWGLLLILEPRRIFVLAGAALTAGAIAVWVFSRTKGISWFPGLEDVEPLEWRDIVTQFFQLLAVAGAALLFVPRSWFRPAGDRAVAALPIAVFAVLAVLTLGVLYAATYDYTHHEGGTEHGH